MDREFLVTSPSVRHERIVTEIFDLCPDIVLARNVHASVEIGNLLEMFDMSVREIGDGLQPVINQPASLCVQRRPYTAATVMSADNDVPHFQYFYRKLKHRQKIYVTRRRKVCDITVHEQFTGVETYDLIGWHTAVATADPEIIGCLLS
ncbi:hypothetical protein HJA_03936 [Hyphomonas jannaschiana VP2]|uniref:Uncharacterized protein n=1 Tax=Hyphomonas jannaschiana VP2 TaxID=1280952 RepID=A0A059FIM7_9PROT|nr:hypothetical protein HJA_03936 [Hyphomonas jannaschiana VP2]